MTQAGLLDPLTQKLRPNNHVYQTQVNLPWYLRPTYSDELMTDAHGHRILRGTLQALVERLALDPLTKDAISKSFRNFGYRAVL